MIEVSRDSGGRGTIKAGSKFRIGNPAKVKFGYRLRSQCMGQDADGDDIDVLLAVEDMDDAAVMTPPDTASDQLAATLRVFRQRVAHLAVATDEAGR